MLQNEFVHLDTMPRGLWRSFYPGTSDFITGIIEAHEKMSDVKRTFKMNPHFTAKYITLDCKI
jgi:hypothetical protein